MDFEGKTVLTNNNKKNQKGQKGNDKRLQKLKHKVLRRSRFVIKGGGGGMMTKCNDVDSVIINSPPKLPFFLKSRKSSNYV